MQEFQQVNQDRVPAEETLRRLAEGDKRFNHLNNTMNDLSTDIKLMKKDVQFICEKLDEHTRQNNEAFISMKEDFKSLKNVLMWVGGLIIAGVIASIFRVVLK